MEQYINKATIVAEIERRMQEHHSGYLVCLKDILSFINTLEVKEVDLEKEHDFLRELTLARLGTAGKVIAKHFYELGLKAQKGE